MRREPTGIPLSPREDEIMQQIVEEAIEVAHAGMKLIRFGKEDLHPETGASSTYTLGLEIGNFITVMNLAAQEKLFLASDVTQGEMNKLERLAIHTKYLP